MAPKKSSNIIEFPAISIEKVEILVFDDDEPGYVRWEFDVPNNHIGKKSSVTLKKKKTANQKVGCARFTKFIKAPNRCLFVFLQSHGAIVKPASLL